MSFRRSESLDSVDKMQGQDDHVEKPNKPGGKPRASRAGTRSVSTLNAEQLARKRENDREAQRAIRQRTKEHIERLEKRIKELSREDAAGIEGDPIYAAIVERNAELEEELRILRSTTYGTEERNSAWDVLPNSEFATSSADMSQPLPPWNELHPRPDAMSFRPRSNLPQTSLWTPQAAQLDNQPRVPPLRQVWQDSANVPTVLQPLETPFGPTYNSIGEGEQHQKDHLQPFSSVPSLASATNPLHVEPGIGSQNLVQSSAQMSTDHLWPRSDSPAVASRSALPLITGTIPMIHSASESIPMQPLDNKWELTIQLSLATNSTETMINAAITHLRSQRAAGVVGIDLLGPPHPNLGLLLEPAYPKPLHPLANALSKFVTASPYRGFVEKIGQFVVAHSMLQWAVASSYDTYSQIPDHFVPLPSQLDTPHPFWVSLLQWPRLRDTVMSNQEKYVTSEFEYMYWVSLHLHWTYQPQEAAQQVGDEWRATDSLVRCARDLRSWSLDELFQRRYPELRDVCTFTEYAPTVSSGSVHGLG